MRLQRIEFGALLSYSPNGRAFRDVASKGVMSAVKNDEFIVAEGRRIQMSEFVAKTVRQKARKPPLLSSF